MCKRIVLHIKTIAFFTVLLVILSSCSLVISNSMDKFGNDFSSAVANHSDPDTVSEGLPAYLILMDSLATKKNAKPQLISSTARLYSAYSSLFVEDIQRQKRLSDIALRYAELALCKVDEIYCNLTKRNFDDFTNILGNYDIEHIELVYTLAQSWAIWIQTHSTDWNAIAQLAQVKWIMQSVIDKDELVGQGGAHVILGILNSLIPPAMGGKPELAKQHFEKALLISGSRNLSIKVDYAEHYARLVFDQELHNKLLNEVLLADPQQNQFVLVNLLAQIRAKKLLESSADYF